MNKLFIIFTILIFAKSFAQCDYTIVNKGNVDVKQFRPVPVTNDEENQYGLSLSSVGSQIFLILTTRYIYGKPTAKQIYLSLDMSDHDAIVILSTAGELDYIDRSNVSHHKFPLDPLMYKQLLKTSILSMRIQINPNFTTLPVKTNGDVIKNSLKCLIK